MCSLSSQLENLNEIIQNFPPKFLEQIILKLMKENGAEEGNECCSLTQEHGEETLRIIANN